jgi:hypothetical protein
MQAGIILTGYFTNAALLSVSFNLTGNLRQGCDVLSGDCGAASMSFLVGMGVVAKTNWGASPSTIRRTMSFTANDACVKFVEDQSCT